MNEVKIRLSQVPSQYHNQLFVNLVRFKGVNGSAEAIIEDALLSGAFPWLLTDEGHEFWKAIDEGIEPGTTVTTTTASSELEDLVKEAEARGFANGVQTKWGRIRDEYEPGVGILPHELLPDGTFYYRNIKVRKANGKWIKPLKQKLNVDEANSDAIHAVIIIETINPN